jgi:hypothetical protein
MRFSSVTTPKAFLFACSCLLAQVGFAASDTSVDEIKNYCGRSSAEANIENGIFELLSNTDLASQLLAGNTQEVINALGQQLSNDAILLARQLKTNPCGVSQETTARIYPALRVLAAANHLRPIPNISHNEELQKILSDAIADNPKHYQQLIERSSKWEHGIK